MEAHSLILWGWSTGQDLSMLWVSFTFGVFLPLVTQAKNCKDLAEEGNKNKVEQHEDTKVVDNVGDHYNNWCKHREDSQEEESLWNQ